MYLLFALIINEFQLNSFFIVCRVQFVEREPLIIIVILYNIYYFDAAERKLMRIWCQQLENKRSASPPRGYRKKKILHKDL